MSEQGSLWCANCGSALPSPVTGESAIVCPVCQLVNPVGAAPMAVLLTTDSLETQLSALLDQARRDGLAFDEIVRVLQDELAFTAELANTGHHYLVQLVDLGPLEVQGSPRIMRERRLPLATRAVGK